MDLKASMDMDIVGEDTLDMDHLDLAATVDHMDLIASMDMATLDMDHLELAATVDHDNSDINWSYRTGHCLVVYFFFFCLL